MCSTGPDRALLQNLTFSAPASSSSYSTSAPPGRPGPAGLEVLTQRRLEQTSTSLEEVLKVAEDKLSQGNQVDR